MRSWEPCVATRSGGGTWYGGRLAVLKQYRRVSGLTGCHLVKMAEDVVRQRGCTRFLAYVQLQNVRFFQHMGWRSLGEPEEHYGQPHMVMEANLMPSTVAVRSLVHA